MSPASELDNVLAWVNETRQAFCLPCLAELPKGKFNDSCECVIGRAINGRAYWGEGYVDVGHADEFLLGSAQHVEFPDYIDKFIVDFDSGKYPELVEETA